MLHAAAMLAGLFTLGLLITQGWASRDAALLAFAAALVSAGVALGFGGFRKTPWSAAPQFLALSAARSAAILRGTAATIRSALAADVTLAPALVRVRTGEGEALVDAAAADLISAVPGSVVVAADNEAMLVHVMNEDAADSSAFAAVHARASELLEKSV